MRIFIDMDGVLADFDSQFNSYLSKAGVLAKRIMSSWKLTDRIIDTNYIKSKNAYVNKILRTPKFWENIKPIPGGADVLQRWLKDKNLEIYIATSPWISSPTCMIEKVNWIRKNIPKFPLSNIIMIAKKHMLQGEVIIDDKPSHIEEWCGEHAICFSQPWNENVKSNVGADKSVWRAGSWNSVDDIIKYIMWYPKNAR
jgi:5'-nucleotidase